MAGVLRELIPENTMVSIGMGQAKLVPRGLMKEMVILVTGLSKVKIDH